ncbi:MULTISPECIES: metallophosphoesterase [unclassified Mesotoga]|uniref:Phosphoesterase n=2 Tax=Mesotoga infera TaxID=1236046 RepID=A0A3D3TMU9_9BACT|nr:MULTISPECIES: metallophosphoesterase family protein [unclassified Mesotoga]PZC51972.1 metallophosphatase [Mesotoga sp. TolDC]HCO70039.1 YfcE family phosphodiesterase [Mesotoga infera]
MRLAFFSDIHGNLEALEAVLKDIESQNIERIYCLGDLVGYGPQPQEVVQRIRDLKIPTIMGNYDDAIGYEKKSCGCAYNPGRETEVGDESLNWTIDNTSAKAKEFLRSLPHTLEFEEEGVKFLLVHGSPVDHLLEYIRPDTSSERLQKVLERVKADVIVNGHTHLPMVRWAMGKLVFNDGSVGRPKDGNPEACYLIVDVIQQSVSYEFRRIEYNVKSTIEKMIEVGLPAELALVLLLGKGYKMGPSKLKNTMDFRI